MALSIGELVGTLRLDDRHFGASLANAQRDFDRGAQQIEKRSDRTRQIIGGALAAGAAAAGLAVVGLTKKAVSLEAEFSKTMNVLQATTNASSEEMQRLSDLAIKMGADTTFSASDASKAMLELARGGIKPAEIEAGALQGTLTLAAAGELDMATAANVAVKAMGQFSLKGKDAGAVAAALAGGANASSASVGAMAEALAQGGLAANSVGFSIQETTGILAAFSNAGLEGSDAGTSLKTALDSLAPSTKSAKDAMKQLGIITEDGRNRFLKANGEYRSAAEIAEVLKTATENLSASERKQAITQMFGSDAQRAATILAKEGAAGIREMVKATSDQDAAQKMAAANMKGTSGAIEALKGSVETVTLQFGLWLQPYLMRALEALTAGVNNVVPGVKTLGRFVGDNATTFKILGAIVLAGTAGWVAYRAAVMVSTAATKVQTLWTTRQTVAQKALNLAMRMNPIGLVISLIAALATGFVLAYKKSETFRRIVNGVWDAVKRGTKTAVLFVADKVLWMAEKMLGAMSTAFSWVPGLGDKMKAAHQAVKGLRVAVNKEMDLMRDEEVKISFAVGRRKSQESSNSGFGPQISGGGGGAPGTGAHAHGGAGLSFATETDAAKRGVSRVAASATAQAAEIAAELAKRERKRMGSLGPSGKVLRPGSYSIGMPYLGYPGHYGADYPAATGTPVYAAASGIVSRALALATSYGKHIFLSHPGGRETRYAHLNSMMVRAGQAVRAGQKIGTVGSTGNSTGPHLHYEDRINGAARNPASLGIFDTGGLARGAGLMVKGPKPERVLSPTQTEWFEKALRNASHGGGRPVEVTINYPASTTPEEAYASSGGRVVAALSALGV